MNGTQLYNYFSMFMTTPSGGIVSFVTVTSAIIHFDSTVITGVDWPSYISCKGKHIINQQKAVVVVDVVDILNKLILCICGHGGKLLDHFITKTMKNATI